MRKTRKAAVAVGLALTLAFVTVTQTACPEGKKLAPYAEDVVESLNLAKPLLEAAGVDMAKVDTAINLGRQLVTALKSEGGGGAGHIVESLIAHFDQIVDQVNKLPIPQERKNQILLGLVGARIALGIIARNIADKAPEGVQQTGKIKEFAKRKKWRCRNSASGRFEKMEYCQKNPAKSVVETYSNPPILIEDPSVP